MTIFGLNSPQIFVILLILLVILGTKRIEIGLNLFSRLLKFLLNNQNNSNKVDKKKEPIKDIEETQAKEEKISNNKKPTNTKEKESIKEIEETQAKEEKISKNEKPTNTKEKEPIKDIEETQAKEEESEKKLKISNVENKVKNSITTNVPKGIKKDKTVNKLKTKVPKRILKEKTARKSKTINQEEQQDK